MVAWASLGDVQFRDGRGVDRSRGFFSQRRRRRRTISSNICRRTACRIGISMRRLRRRHHAIHQLRRSVRMRCCGCRSSFRIRADAARYHTAAEKILGSLASSAYLAEGSKSAGILLHGARFVSETSKRSVADLGRLLFSGSDQSLRMGELIRRLRRGNHTLILAH